MKNICFFDLFNDGHHWFYNYNIMKETKDKCLGTYYYTSNLNNQQISNLNNNKIKFYQHEANNKKSNKKIQQLMKDLIIFVKVYKYCIKNNIKTIVLLHMDSQMVGYCLLSRMFKKNNIKVVCVQHWFPNNKIKKLILKKVVKKDTVIVHTEDVLIKINLLNNSNYKHNVIKVNYPLSESKLVERNEARKILNINNDKFTLLYFGGTRHDKGLDLLLKALDKVNNDIFIIIAGKEETFKREFIINELNKSDIEFKLELKFIKDEEIKYYFSAADTVVLPYRSYFNGESGIFSEAINFAKPVIVPNIIHFPNIIMKNNNGIVYEVENIESLSKAIDAIKTNYQFYLENAVKFSEKYRQEHSIHNFVKQYIGIFERI